MSALGAAVKAELDGRGLRLAEYEIEKVLLEAGVTSTASRGVPVGLRIRNLQVTGTKRYSDGPDIEGSVVTMIKAPFELNWSPRDGVNGVGSEANLRGKSSVLHFVRWAMTGRSHLQDDVLAWVTRVYAEFSLDGVPLFVEINMNDGVPAGTVHQQISTGRALLGSFEGEAEFESLIGSVMLDRLRLDSFPVFAKGGENEHSWPSYVAALTVYANQLDPIIGNESTLKTRSLQMLVGTSWARADAEVATALNTREFRRKEAAARRSEAGPSVRAIEQAEQRVAEARARLAQYSSDIPDMNKVLSLGAEAAARAQEAHSSALQLMTARDAAAQVDAHVRAEQLRRQATAEDAIARRLFNGMMPTACPRCSTKVTAERYKAEAAEHECSLCTADLDHKTAPDSTQPSQVADIMHRDEASISFTPQTAVDENDGKELGADSLQALHAAAAEAQAMVDTLERTFHDAETARLSAEAAAQTSRNDLGGVRARLAAEFEVARAEGAFESLQRTVTVDNPATSNDDDKEMLVLQVAHKITKRWVKDEQDPVLAEVSNEIADLSRRFGATNIISVDLKGNGNMDVNKGGAPTTYSRVTNGEKLRIKIAAAIALIRIGHRDGVGRHPGLLFIDSPAAEEIPEADLRTMLQAMSAVAEETAMQIVVATTHGAMLREMLPPENALVASGSDFVW